MKKLMVAALCGAMAISAFASTKYHVYDIKMSVKTTVAKGSVTTDCGDEYNYRDKGSSVIKGVLGGCGCGSILANGTCEKAILYMWDETHKIAITNVETETGWRVQRIGKNQTVVEHFVQLSAVYGENDEYSFNVVLSGFGTYKVNKNDVDACYVSNISGNFAGFASAPYLFKKGSCSACGVIPSQYVETDATSLCDECGLGEDYFKTPFYGTYTVKYNSGKTNNISKKGLSQKDLGLPDYVGLLDYVATNIGE